MPVITVSRQTGSGGATVGRRLAEQLGATYLNEQILRTVAERLGISEAAAAAHDERVENFLERLARVLWISHSSFSPTRQPATPVAFETTTEAFVAATRELIQEAARSGNAVIFGHGAQFVLAGQPGVLHVRFVAPLAYRVDRVMQRESLSREAAERWVREEDQRRAAHIREHFHADWNSPEHFHLILNTALWDVASCVRLVLAAVEELKRRGVDQA
ncbi:MAG: cytidylate kinase-like family protein [Chloroflexota bacterium]|nr:cytidylate kinase-like family protein [Chloroflexota bacterium]